MWPGQLVSPFVKEMYGTIPSTDTTFTSLLAQVPLDLFASAAIYYSSTAMEHVL